LAAPQIAGCGLKGQRVYKVTLCCRAGGPQEDRLTPILILCFRRQIPAFSVVIFGFGQAVGILPAQATGFFRPIFGKS
jgi:hypothetical protein